MTAHRSLRVLGRSLLQAVPTVIGVVLLSFFLLQAVPGDAADVIAAESGSATEASMAALRSHIGLDQPVLQQLGAYLRDLATLNLGVSPRYNLPVSELIFSRLGNTVLLMGSALACALAAGIALGAVMASFAGRWLDRVLSLAALLLPACSDLGPTPSIERVTPSAAYSDVAIPIVVDAPALREALVVDVSGQTASYEEGTIHMALVGDDPGLPGSVDLGPIQSVDDLAGTMFLGTIPAGLPAGAYGLRVTPPSGHSVIRHGEFQELGPDLTPPMVSVDSPSPGATLGVGDKATTVTASVRVDDGDGQLVSVTWSTSNRATGACQLRPQPPTNALPGRVACPASFPIAPLDPANGLGVPFWFHVDAVDVAGNVTSLTVDLVVASLPKILSFERTYGALEGRQPFTIHGAYFTPDAKAFIDSNAVVGLGADSRIGGDVLDAGTIVGLTPRNALPHDATVSVQTLAGVGDGPSAFRYTAPPNPRLIQPASGPVSGGVRVTVGGNDLLDGVIISFGGTFETSVPFYNAQYTSNDKVYGCLPPGQKGPVTVWASDPVTGLGSLMGAFTYTDDQNGTAAMTAPTCQTADTP